MAWSWESAACPANVERTNHPLDLPGAPSVNVRRSGPGKKGRKHSLPNLCLRPPEDKDVLVASINNPDYQASDFFLLSYSNLRGAGNSAWACLL